MDKVKSINKEDVRKLIEAAERQKKYLDSDVNVHSKVGYCMSANEILLEQLKGKRSII
jgi:hypothetical protein